MRNIWTGQLELLIDNVHQYYIMVRRRFGDFVVLWSVLNQPLTVFQVSSFNVTGASTVKFLASSKPSNAGINVNNAVITINVYFTYGAFGFHRD